MPDSINYYYYEFYKTKKKAKEVAEHIRKKLNRYAIIRKSGKVWMVYASKVKRKARKGKKRKHKKAARPKKPKSLGRRRSTLSWLEDLGF